MQLAQLYQRADTAAKATAVAAAFVVPLSTALLSVSLALFALFWLLSGNYQDKFQRVRDNPAALWALALFGWLAVGVGYSSSGMMAALSTLKKYLELLYLVLLMGLIDDAKWRKRAYSAFVLSLLLTLAVSYLKWFGWIPHEDAGHGYAPFRSRIAHNLFMAFGAYLMLHHMLLEPRYRWFWGMAAAAATYNVLFMVNGRTGQIVLLLLILLAAWQRWGRRGVLLGAMISALLAVTAFSLPSDFQSRTWETFQDIRRFQQGEISTPTGLRLEFYRNTLELIAQHPILGGGTGSSGTEYRKLAEQKGRAITTANPHNEYLLITQQSGLIGLTLMLMMGYSQWRWARRLEPEYRIAAQGLLVTMAVGCLFNSLLLDSNEGKFYAVMAGVLLSGYPQVQKDAGL
jgi:O-antigen ligase